MIEMEEMSCAVDDRTYAIVDGLFGRVVSQKLLYEDVEQSKISLNWFTKSLRMAYRLLQYPW